MLHKKVLINRGRDEITAWCFPEECLKTYSYALVKQRKEPAFTTQEVGFLLNRRRTSLQMAISRGDVPEPQWAYKIEGGGNGRKTRHLWHEDDIIAAHDYFSSLHAGPPRKDGLITPHPLPSVREIRALIQHEEALYVKVGDEFLPTYQAPNI